MTAASTRRELWLLVFALIAASFLVGTALTQWHMRAVDRAAADVAENASPSIERLALARSEVRRLQVLMRDALDRQGEHGAADFGEVDRVRAEFEDAVDGYLQLPIFPGEHDLWAEILRRKDAFAIAIGRFESQAEHGAIADAAGALRNEVASAADAFDSAVSRDVEFNARHSHDLAMQIRAARTGASRVGYVADAIAILVTVAGAVVLGRVNRTHAELVERNRRLEAERASELEQFAGRVAHDILSPLGTVAFALAATTRDAEQRARFAGRGTAALERVQRLVNGLLAFARAGARPEGGASADVRTAVADLVGELTPLAKEVGIELEADVQAGAVACNDGVLTSLVANLARNAIKYIGDGHERRIRIRAVERGDLVRVEVEDTGPGLPPGLEEQVFDPYVRGRHLAQPGIGLGLATVKRIAEAHRGRVGVRSEPGRGCTFWFELPRASREASERMARAPLAKQAQS